VHDQTRIRRKTGHASTWHMHMYMHACMHRKRMYMHSSLFSLTRKLVRTTRSARMESKVSALLQTVLPFAAPHAHIASPCREEMMELGEEDKDVSCLEFMRKRFDSYAQGSKHERDMLERCFGAKCLLQAAEEGEFLHKLSTRQVPDRISITRIRFRVMQEISRHACSWSNC
jgi:hypothetical protein